MWNLLHRSSAEDMKVRYVGHVAPQWSARLSPVAVTIPLQMLSTLRLMRLHSVSLAVVYRLSQLDSISGKCYKLQSLR
jgi:hypothetical protein